MFAQFAQASALCCPEKAPRWSSEFIASRQQPPQPALNSPSHGFLEPVAKRPVLIPPSTNRLVFENYRTTGQRPKSAMQIGTDRSPIIISTFSGALDDSAKVPTGESDNFNKVPFKEIKDKAIMRKPVETVEEGTEAVEEDGTSKHRAQQEQQREARIEKTKRRLLLLAQTKDLLGSVKTRTFDQKTVETCPPVEIESTHAKDQNTTPKSEIEEVGQKRRAFSVRPVSDCFKEDDMSSRRSTLPAQVTACTSSVHCHALDENIHGSITEAQQVSESMSAALKLPVNQRTSSKSRALSPASSTSRSQAARSSALSVSSSQAPSSLHPVRLPMPRTPRNPTGSFSIASPRSSVFLNAIPRSSVGGSGHFNNPLLLNLGWEHERCKQRLSTNKSIQKKLRAFDMRNSHRQQSTAAAHHKEAADLHAQGEDTPKTNQNRGEEVELSFHIVGWSSQKGRCEATRLLERRGKWESNTHSDEVHNEYLVFGLHGLPCAVTGVELTMGGTSANPRRCRMQYSEASQNGPWLDAWNFAIEPAGALTYRSHHEYGVLSKQFRSLVLSYSGSFEVAWYLFDVNENGKLSKTEFEAACTKFQDRYGGATLQIDPLRIFREFDPTATGEVSLDDLFNEDPKLPMAPWWRILIVDNYGSPNSVMLFSPLRLFSTELASEEAAQTRKGGLYQQTMFMEGMVAAHQNLFHTTPEMRMLRRTANQYELPVDEVEAFHKDFKNYSLDGENISRPEFDRMLVKLHGLGEKDDLPAKRLEFFWRQADEDNNGTIDFEEFLVWYFKKSPLKAR